MTGSAITTPSGRTSRLSWRGWACTAGLSAPPPPLVALAWGSWWGGRPGPSGVPRWRCHGDACAPMRRTITAAAAERRPGQHARETVRRLALRALAGLLVIVAVGVLVGVTFGFTS